MDEDLQLLDETIRNMVARLWTDDARRTAGSDMPKDLWNALDDAGFTSLGSLDDGLPGLVVIATAVGRAAMPVPLVEMSGLAAWLCATAGIELGGGIATCAIGHPSDRLTATPSGNGWTIDGQLHLVPWAAEAEAVVAIADTADGPTVVRLLSPTVVDRRENLAAEPRGTIRLDGFAVPFGSGRACSLTHDDLLVRGALLRCASTVGAMETALDMAVRHTTQRRQFGKPVSTFYAVQQHLVVMAEQLACAQMAVAAATVSGEKLATAVGATKVIVTAAADIVAASAHQVHGAIGVTDEYPLHHYTRRLWAWRDEFGSPESWSRRLGSSAFDCGAQALWPAISAPLVGS